MKVVPTTSVSVAMVFGIMMAPVRWLTYVKSVRDVSSRRSGGCVEGGRTQVPQTPPPRRQGYRHDHHTLRDGYHRSLTRSIGISTSIDMRMPKHTDNATNSGRNHASGTHDK